VKRDLQELKLIDVCELVNGRAYGKAELLTEGKYPVLRVGNFFTNNNWYHSDLELPEEKYCDQGDLLYAWSASFGPRVWSGPKVIFHYHIWKVVPDESLIDKRFLYYFFLWDTEQIKKDQGAGTTMLHVSKGSMEQRGIFMPTLETQRLIVTILDEAFEGIATAKAHAEQNLRNIREVLAMSVDDLFRSLICDSTTLFSMGELATFRNGINFTKSSKGDRVRIIGVKDFQQNFDARIDDLECVTLDGGLAASDCVAAGDIVFVRSNGNPELIGRCMLVGTLVEPTVHSGFTIKMRLHDQRLDARFLCHYLKSTAIRQELVDGGNGANIKSLNQGTLSAVRVPVPSKSLQRELVDRIEALENQVVELTSVYQRKLTALTELQQSLLHQAFTGQL
jgi:type I restriction enzyme S subunit